MKKSPLARLIWPIYAPSFIYSAGSGAVIPVIALAALAIGFTDAHASAVVGVFGLVGIVMSPIIGRIITRIGDRIALISGAIIALLALVGAILSLSLPEGDASRALFVVAIVLLSLAGNVWSLARQAYIAQTVPATHRARALSTLGGMIRLGVLVGPIAATAVLAIWPLVSVFWLEIATTIAAGAMVIAFVLPDSDQGVTAKQSAAPQPEREPVIPSLYATFIVGVGINALNILRANRSVIVPLWGSALGFQTHFITATFAVTALLDAAIFFISGILMDKRGRLWALVPSLTIMPVAIVVMVLWQTPVGFVVGAALLGLGNGFGSGIVMTTGADLSPATRKADFLGIWQAIVAVGTALGPFIIGWLTDSFSLAVGLWATAGIGVLGMVWLVLLIKPAYRRLGIDLRGAKLESAQ